MSDERPRIEWVTHFGSRALDAGSKSAHVSRLIVPLLCRMADVTVFVDGTADDQTSSRGVRFRPLSELPERSAVFRIVQAEDRTLSPSFIRALQSGGELVWCHDLHERGSQRRVIVDSLPAFAHAAFSSERNLAQASSLVPNSRLSLLHYPVNDIGPLADNELNDDGIEPGSDIGTAIGSASNSRTSHKGIAYCGSPYAEDQSHVMFRTLRELKCGLSVEWLIRDEEHDEAARIAAENADIPVRFTQGKSSDRWVSILRRSCCALHLHFSAYGDYGPLLPVSLMAAMPVCISDFGDADSLPPGAVYKIETGERANSSLLDSLSRVLSDATERQERSRAARVTALERWDCRAVCAELLHLIEAVRIGSFRGAARNEAASGIASI